MFFDNILQQTKFILSADYHWQEDSLDSNQTVEASFITLLLLFFAILQKELSSVGCTYQSNKIWNKFKKQ